MFDSQSQLNEKGNFFLHVFFTSEKVPSYTESNVKNVSYFSVVSI